MTIKVYADRIEIGAKTITTTPTGIRIGDSLAANTQQQGYINQANFTARELAFGNFVFQGSVAGFTAGGFPGPGSALNTIDKFPFTTDTNATDVGDLPGIVAASASQSSSTHGYASGGYYASGGFAPSKSEIAKFSFSNNSNGTFVGELSQDIMLLAGQSSSVNGYTSGGYSDGGSRLNIIQKFLFATDTNATDVGDLFQTRSVTSGQSSTTHGYNSGGPAPAVTNTIDKFPFSADTNATDVGDLTETKRYSTGQSSTTHGYVSGGYKDPGDSNIIEKFPFATDTNATDVGDLTGERRGVAGQSSTTHGYASGGVPGPVNTIEKFPFSADTNASDVGDLTLARFFSSGTQF